MQTSLDPNKDNRTMNDIRIQQFLDATRAYLFGLATPQVSLATIPTAGSRTH